MAESGSSEESSWDVFVSYARRDNTTGWVTRIVDKLRQTRPAAGAPALRVFFDTAEIRGMDDWRQRLEGALRRSHVLIVCRSPAWAASEWCRLERSVFRSTRQERRQRTPNSIGVIRLADIGAGDALRNDDEVRKALDDLDRLHDLLNLCTEFLDAAGAISAPDDLAFANWPAASRSLLADLQTEREAQRAQGNLRAGNRNFVGREEGLVGIHRAAALGQPGLVTVLQAPGGIGKTELALQYGHRYAWHYTGGLWMVNAEGQNELLPLLGRLGEDPVFRDLHGREGMPFAFSESERADAHAQGRRVLHEMLQRAQRLRDAQRQVLAAQPGAPMEPVGGGGAVLVILDNVDRPELLSQGQLQDWPELNEGHECIRFLATSRIGADQWRGSPVQLVQVGMLKPEESLELMQRHRKGLAWPDADYECGVRGLSALLDGYTLLVEQVAAYLALNPDVRPEALLEAFKTQGLTEGDALLSYDERLSGVVRHDDKFYAIVLSETLRSLDGLPLARAALEHAAWMPPDHICWAWLEGMLREASPQSFDLPPHRPAPWLKAVERLEAARLLMPVSDGVARLHRLIGDHLRKEATGAAHDSAALPSDATHVQVYTSEKARVIASAVDENLMVPEHDRLALREVAFHGRSLSFAEQQVGTWARVAASIEQTHGSLALAGELSLVSLQCFERGATASPEDPDIEWGLAAASQSRADFLQARGQDGDAVVVLGHAQRSLELREALLRANPGSGQAARDVSVSLNRLADFLQGRGQDGDAAAALGHVQRSLELREALLRANPGSGQAARDVSVSLNRLADFLQGRGQDGDAAAALGHAQRSLELREALLRANPGTGQAARDVSISLSKLADFLQGRGQDGDAAVALGHAQRSVELCEALLRANPGTGQAARDVSVSLSKLADFLQARGQGGDAAVALVHRQRSLELMRLVEHDVDRLSELDIRTLTGLLIRCVATEGTRGEIKEATDHDREAFALLDGWLLSGRKLDKALMSLRGALREAGL